MTYSDVVRIPAKDLSKYIAKGWSVVIQSFLLSEGKPVGTHYTLVR